MQKGNKTICISFVEYLTMWALINQRITKKEAQTPSPFGIDIFYLLLSIYRKASLNKFAKGIHE